MGGSPLLRLPVALLRLHGRWCLRHHGVGGLPEGQFEASQAGLAPRAVQDRVGQARGAAEETQRLAAERETSGSRELVE